MIGQFFFLDPLLKIRRVVAILPKTFFNEDFFSFFPDAQRKEVLKSVQAILDAGIQHSVSTLADLFVPLARPPVRAL